MLDDPPGYRYNNSRSPGVRDSLSVFPTFQKMAPGSKERYVMPPFYTPGDGRVDRQGTSLLYRAGEKTRASAPWGPDKNTPAHPVCFYLLMYRLTVYSTRLRCLPQLSDRSRTGQARGSGTAGSLFPAYWRTGSGQAPSTGPQCLKCFPPQWFRPAFSGFHCRLP